MDPKIHVVRKNGAAWCDPSIRQSDPDPTHDVCTVCADLVRDSLKTRSGERGTK